MRRLLFGLLFAALAGPALAQTQPSAYPMATLPLGQVGTDAVLIDQCQQGMLNCVTRQAPSVRIGQPVQQTSAPTTPFAYQQWIDTSQNPPQLKEYIGSTWYKVATLDPSNGYVLSIPSSSITGLGTMATQNASAVAITGGTITGMPVPTSASDVATKSYVDGNAAGLVIETGVKWATAAILPNTPTYNNGAAGVGATLTAGSSTTLTVDGNVVALNDRVLVKNEATQANNGCYSLTTAGGAVPWVLTRCADFDQPAEVVNNAYFLVSSGSANASSSWVLRISGTPVIGTTVLPFQQFGSSQIYTASTGLSLIGGAFSITNTGVTAATYGDATHVGQFTVNAQGQLTSASSVAMLPTIASINAGSFTTGSVPYISGGAFAQDNTNFFWDSTNHRLGIKTASPAYPLQVSGSASASNFVIGGEATTDAGTVGFTTVSGPSIQLWGTASAGSGDIRFTNAGTLHMTLTNAGNLSLTGQYQVNGTQIAAANLSNGTTGSGAVVLATSPSITTNATIGGAAGSTSAPTTSNTNILLYNNSSTNWSGIGSDVGGNFYVTTGTAGVATRLSINPSGGVRLWNYGAGALSSDGSGNISAGTLAVANGGTGTTASFGSGNVLLASAQSSNSSGYTWVGGVLIQWTTSANFAGGNTAAVTWPIAFPTGVFQVTATMGGANIAVGAGGTSTTGTTLTASANNSSTASVVAIGH